MDIKTEVLYLARGGKQDIFIEKCPKQQNVVNGIRFLYRQYAKKIPGVILNDSNSHNRRIQTVLFVSAMQPILERPVLILCTEGDERKWRECFEIWTNMANDITTDTINPLAKKVSVYISPIQDITKFNSREWSGVIIDSDVIHKQILRININAKFKVWITGVDVKNDLKIFSHLYKWIYPKEKFDPNMFHYDVRNPNDVVAKTILLDTFMEDVVLRTNVQQNTIVKSPEIPKVTRKNKDATGTKIKRTKRKNRISSSEDDSPTKTSKTNETASNDNNNKNITLKNANISEIDSRATINGSRATNDNSRATIDDFRVSVDDTRATIDDSRPTIEDTRATIDDSRSNVDGTIATLDNTRTTYDVLSNKTVDSSKIRIEYYDEDQTNDKRDKINEILEKSPIICGEENNSMDLLLKYEVDETYTPLDRNNEDRKPESNDSAYDKDTQEIFDEIIKFKDKESCQGNIKDGTKTNDDNNIHLVSNEITSNDKIIQNINKIENEIDLIPKELTKEVKKSEDLFSTESITNLNEIKKQNERDLKPKETKLHSEDLFSTESMSNLNKIVNKNVKDGVANSDASSSFDAKIKQMEELAMKKFKGSLLDSIF